MHYGYVALGTFATTTNDVFKSIQIDDDIIAPTIALNGFAKGRHGMLCWEVLDFVIENPDLSLLAVGADRDLRSEWSITGDNSRTGTVRTARATPNVDDWVCGDMFRHETKDDADGTIVMQRDDKLQIKTMPQQILDSNSFGKLLTAAHYNFNIDSNEAAALLTWTLGANMRRVLVPLTEAFFDQRTVAELLLGAQLFGFGGR